MVTIAGDSIIGIVGAIIAIVVLIANAVFINDLRTALAEGTVTLNISLTGADVIFWVDVVLAVLFGIYLIYNIWRIFTSPEQRAELGAFAGKARRRGGVVVAGGPAAGAPAVGLPAIEGGAPVVQARPGQAPQAPPRRQFPAGQSPAEVAARVSPRARQGSPRARLPGQVQ